MHTTIDDTPLAHPPRHAKAAHSHPETRTAPRPPARDSAFGDDAPARDALAVRWARDDSELRAAQRLRHRVFVQEMGARILVLGALEHDERSAT